MNTANFHEMFPRINVLSDAATTSWLRNEVFQMQNSYLSPSKAVIKLPPK